MDTILLVEDDALLRHTLKETLEFENFIVFEAVSGKRLIDILQHHHVDLILLDLRLADGSGLDFMHEIRGHTDVPLIIVSGEPSRSERIKGLDMGADDCVRKPFEMGELVARIRANLRRYRSETANQNQRSKQKSDAERVRFGNWTLDRTQFQIYDKNNRSGDLTAREFRLLETMIENAGRVLRREDLGEALQEENYRPTPRAIDVKIARIRKKIGDDAAQPRIIKTVRGVGYSFDGDVGATE